MKTLLLACPTKVGSAYPALHRPIQDSVEHVLWETLHIAPLQASPILLNARIE